MEARAQIEKKLAQKQKEMREENLRQLAQKARDERAGIRRVEGNPFYLTMAFIIYKPLV